MHTLKLALTLASMPTGFRTAEMLRDLREAPIVNLSHEVPLTVLKPRSVGCSFQLSAEALRGQRETLASEMQATANYPLPHHLRPAPHGRGPFRKFMR